MSSELNGDIDERGGGGGGVAEEDIWRRNILPRDAGKGSPDRQIAEADLLVVEWEGPGA